MSLRSHRETHTAPSAAPESHNSRTLVPVYDSVRVSKCPPLSITCCDGVLRRCAELLFEGDDQSVISTGACNLFFVTPVHPLTRVQHTGKEKSTISMGVGTSKMCPNCKANWSREVEPVAKYMAVRSISAASRRWSNGDFQSMTRLFPPHAGPLEGALMDTTVRRCGLAFCRSVFALRVALEIHGPT